jgi:hypothetical protein
LLAATHSIMDQLNKLLRNDLTGDLDFITTDEIVFEGGNLGIPSFLIPQIYVEALEAIQITKGK